MSGSIRTRVQPSIEVFFLLLLTCWVAHFVFFERFRIYEDDYIHSLPQMTWSSHDLGPALTRVILNPPESRPLGFLICDLEFFLLMRGGSVQIGYLFGMVLITVNSFLLYLFLKREFGRVPAIVGALVYLLYPADTCRQILMHQPFLHLGWLILLTALLLYQRRRPVLAFLVVSLCLISYESFYLPFLFAPLVCRSSGLLRLRRLILHAIIFFSVAGAVFAVRSISGEERAGLVMQNLYALPIKILQACTLGPIVSGQLLFSRPVDALLNGQPAEYLAGFIVAAICFFLFNRMRTPAELNESVGSTIITRSKTLWPALLGGLLAWAFSYFLSFREGYFPPLVTIGRLTAVHSVGEFGAAVIIAGVVTILQPRQNRIMFLGLAVAASLYFGLLTVFGVHIQSSEYVTQGEEQAIFWRTIMRTSGDLGPHDIILFEEASDPVTAPVTPGFPSFGELNYFPMASAVFAKSATNKAVSFRIFGLWPECGFEDTPQGRRLHTPVWAPGLWPTVTDYHFIYFKMEAGQLKRVTQPVNILGKWFTPIPQPAELAPPLEETKLFRRIFGEEQSSNWFTIRDAPNYP
jgi:hypothetical protein